MPDVTYQSLQSQIQTQKTQIQSQRTTISQEKIAGERGIQSLKRVHPRADPSVWEERKPRIESIKGRLGELGEAEKELDISESKLLEQEKLLESKKEEGWKLREKNGSIEFFKETPVAPSPGEPVGEFTIRIRWRRSTGEVTTVRGPASNLETMRQQIADRGGQILDVESLGGGREFRTPEMRTTTGGSFLLYEAPPIVKDPSKTIKEIEAYTTFYEKIPESIIKKRVLPTPEKFAEVRGLPSDVFGEYVAAREVTTTTRTFTQSEIDQLLAGKTEEEKLRWYKANVQFGEEKKSWADIKKDQPDWDLKVKAGKVIIATPETDREQLLKVMGEQYGELPPPARIVRAGAITYLSLFRPETWIAAFLKPRPSGGILLAGVVSPEAAVSVLEWEYPITKIEKPLEKWMAVQRPAYEHVIIPFVAGAGIGKAFQLIGGAAKVATGATAKVLSQFAKKVPYVYGGVISTMVGADIGYTAAMEEAGLVKPDTTLAKVSRYGVQFGFAIAGARWATAPRQPIIKKGVEITEITKPGVPFKGGIARRYVEIFGKRVPYGKRLVGVKPDTLFVRAVDPYLAYARVSRYGVVGVTPTVVGEPPMPTALVVRPTTALVSTEFPVRAIGLAPGVKPLWRIPFEPKTRVELKAERELRKLWDEKQQRQYEDVFRRAGEKLEVGFKPRVGKPVVTRLEAVDERLGYGRITKYGVTDTVPTVPRPTGIETMGMERYLHWIREKGWLRGIYKGLPEGPLGVFMPGVGEGIIEIHPKQIKILRPRKFDTTLRHELIHFHERTSISEKDIPYEERPSEIFAYRYEKTKFPFIKKEPEWLKYESELQQRLREAYPEYVKGALVVRPQYPLAVTEVPGIVTRGRFQFRPLGAIPFEPKTRIELKAERELKRLWDESLQKEYEDNLRLVSEKFRTSFKRPEPKDQVLRVEEIGEGYARVFKYGVRGVTPTVVGEPPVPGPGIYTGRQPILRPISALTVWDWLSMQPIRPEVVKEPVFKISQILMKPLRYTLKDIIEEPKIEPGDVITRDGQILKTVTKVKTEPPMFRPKFLRPEPVFDPLDVFEDYEFVRNEVVESFGKLAGKPTVKPVGPAVIQRDMLLMFPILKAEPEVKLKRLPMTAVAMDRDVKQMQSQFPISKMDQRFIFDTTQVYDTAQIQEQAQEQMQMQEFKTATVQEQAQFQAQMQQQAQMQMQKLIQEQITTTKKKKIFGILPDTAYKMFGHTMGQGYHVYVKERHYFKGKKVKEGKMIRLSKRPLSRQDALSLGGMAIDNSATATFNIKPVNAMAQEPLIKLTPFGNIKHKFRMKDSKYVEKTTHRIDTRGEVQGISALGWYADKTKKAIKKKPVRRPKVVREPVDMFDRGMDDMMINMDKIFKGVTGFGF